MYNVKWMCVELRIINVLPQGVCHWHYRWHFFFFFQLKVLIQWILWVIYYLVNHFFCLWEECGREKKERNTTFKINTFSFYVKENLPYWMALVMLRFRILSCSTAEMKLHYLKLHIKYYFCFSGCDLKWLLILKVHWKICSAWMFAKD